MNHKPLGFYLGDLPRKLTVSFNEDKGGLRIRTFNNPATFVPEHGRIVWGSESLWYEIKG